MNRNYHSQPLPMFYGAMAAITITSLTTAWPALAQTASPPTPIMPIEHVILIIGENRSFDHVWATYTPKSGQTVYNLLSQGIVNADGTPGPNFSKAAQNQADVTGTTTYQLSPSGQTPYSVLPPAMTDGAPTAASDENPPPFATLAAATSSAWPSCRCPWRNRTPPAGCSPGRRTVRSPGRVRGSGPTPCRRSRPSPRW